MFNDFQNKMKSTNRCLLFLIIILFEFAASIEANCQEEEVSEIIIDIAEDLAADESDPEAVSGFIERLRELAEDPVKINSLDAEELSRLFFLSDFQLKVLHDYILTAGSIMTPFEISNIPGFDRSNAEMMIPFITFTPEMGPAKMGAPDWRSTFLTNLTTKTPSDTGMIGSPWKVLSRYKIKAGSFSGGFTAEKDAGERFMSDKKPLTDFFSAHLSYKGQGLLRQIIIGDYAARFGYGTNINTGIRTALSVASPGNLQGRNEIKPYTATDENNFFRGGAAELSVKNISLFAFYSVNRSDATTAAGGDSSYTRIESFYKSGLHNKNSLLQKKDTYTENNYGINLSFSSDNIRIGLLWSVTGLSLPVFAGSGKPGDLYDFTGDFNCLYTAYYKSQIRKILLTGELSVRPDQSFALIQGVSLRPSDRLTINMLYRNYARGFFSFHGRGPGISSSTSNETGIMGNFTFEAAKNLFISAGCDIHNFPWLRYRSSSPSYGKKQEIRLKYSPRRNISIEASYNTRSTMSDKEAEAGIPWQEKTLSNTFKTTIKYSPHPQLKFSTRIDYKTLSPGSGRGTLLLQDISYAFASLPLNLWFRHCIFGTDDWGSRIYTWENDLLYNFSIPALSGKGSRSYIMAGWEIRDFADFRIKYAATLFSGTAHSSDDKKEIRIQFTARF
jgi:hypothetical protein